MTDLKLLLISVQTVLLCGQFTNEEIGQQHENCASEIALNITDIRRLHAAMVKHQITVAEQEAFSKAKPHERQTMIDKKNKAAEVDKRIALGERFYAFEKCMMTLSESVVGKD